MPLICLFLYFKTWCLLVTSRTQSSNWLHMDRLHLQESVIWALIHRWMTVLACGRNVPNYFRLCPILLAISFWYDHIWEISSFRFRFHIKLADWQFLSSHTGLTGHFFCKHLVPWQFLPLHKLLYWYCTVGLGNCILLYFFFHFWRHWPYNKSLLILTFLVITKRSMFHWILFYNTL